MQKLTPFIVNYLFLIIISSTLLVFNNESQGKEVSKGKYAIDFLCTPVASAGNGLFLSLMQLILRKVLKKNTLCVFINMVFYQSLVATCELVVVVFFLFASREWKTLNSENEKLQTMCGFICLDSGFHSYYLACLLNCYCGIDPMVIFFVLQ